MNIFDQLEQAINNDGVYTSVDDSGTRMFYRNFDETIKNGIDVELWDSERVAENYIKTIKINLHII